MESKQKQLRTPIEKLEPLINLINCFETEQGKMFWICALKVDDCIKGRLCHYFKIYQMED